MTLNFGHFTLDTSLYELRREGEPVALEPQAFNLLTYLIQNRDRVVSKDEVISAIWDGRIVSDEAVSNRINAVRRALGDDGKSQTLIRTIPRRGFRFVAEVVEAEEKSVDPSGLQAEPVAPKERPVVAVLPFINLSDSAEQEYLADGLTEDIIAQLSQHRWLRVIARNTAYGFKNRTDVIQELGETLGVDYVVEGSVRRNETRLRVSARLIDVGSAGHLWGETYDREFQDLFDLQDEITATIVARVEPELGLAERHRVERAQRTNLHAWDCFHLGMSHFYRFTAEDNEKAQILLGRSVVLDPQFGEAHAWWAYATILGMVYWTTEPNPKLLKQAMAAADKALLSDSRNASFYMIKARIALASKKYDLALSNCETAMKLNPTYAVVHCAMGDALAYNGHYDEALPSFEKAISLSPNDPQKWAFLSYGALALIFKGEHAKAVKWAKQASVIPNRQYWTISHLAVALAHLGELDQAREAMQQLCDEMPLFSIAFARDKLFYISRTDQLNIYLDGLRMAGAPEN